MFVKSLASVSFCQTGILGVRKNRSERGQHRCSLVLLKEGVVLDKDGV